MVGRYFEGFAVGDEYRHPLGRTVSEADSTWFTLLTMNTNQSHYNADVVTGLSVLDISRHAFANLAGR